MALVPKATLTSKLPPLVGNKGACTILGIQKSTLSRWMKPGTGPHGDDGTYMLTPRLIEAGPVWAKSDVEAFRDEREETERRRVAEAAERADAAAAA